MRRAQKSKQWWNDRARAGVDPFGGQLSTMNKAFFHLYMQLAERADAQKKAAPPKRTGAKSATFMGRRVEPTGLKSFKSKQAQRDIAARKARLAAAA